MPSGRHLLVWIPRSREDGTSSSFCSSCVAGGSAGWPGLCLCQIWAGRPFPRPASVSRPVLLTAQQVLAQVLPVLWRVGLRGGGEHLFQQWLEVVQAANRQPGRLFEQGDGLARAAEQDGVADGFQRHSGTVPVPCEALVRGVEAALHTAGLQEGLAHAGDVGSGGIGRWRQLGVDCGIGPETRTDGQPRAPVLVGSGLNPADPLAHQFLQAAPQCRAALA